MNALPKQIILIVLIAVVFLLSLNTSYSQSIQFQYGQNGNVTNKQIAIDKKDFVIVGSDIVCKGKSTEYIVSTNETALWSNGVIGVKTTFTITKDTIIKAVITNKYGCEYSQSIRVKAAELPLKPVIERFGDSLIVKNITGQFEWYRNGQLFSVGLNLIRTSIEGIYSVKITDGNGCENISDGFNFIISTTKEISTRIYELYPNPSVDKVWIKSNLNLLKDSSIKLFGIDGKELQIDYNDEYINISHLPNGYYIILIRNNYSNVSLPFIKVDQ